MGSWSLTRQGACHGLGRKTHTLKSSGVMGRGVGNLLLNVQEKIIFSLDFQFFCTLGLLQNKNFKKRELVWLGRKGTGTPGTKDGA